MGDTLSNTITGPIIRGGTLYTSPFTKRRFDLTIRLC
jgi:hypothetical protein